MSAPAAAEILAGAATNLEKAVAKGGFGWDFDVVARSTLHARPDGPRIEIPDPNDGASVARVVDELYVGASIASGMVRPDAFSIQMREGPRTSTEAPDFTTAPTTLAGLLIGDSRWRNDGDGWYLSDAIPGIGLDPATARLLPKLLREATDPTGSGTDLPDGTVRDTVTASGSIANAPGLMAIDAVPFSELAGPIDFAFDDQGRLVTLTARIRNTNVDDFDLIVETVITFRYDGLEPLPKPEPTAPPAAPADQ